MFYLQTIILFAGTVFAWTTVFFDFSRFYNLYGTVAKVTGCTIPNPITTPCFYGALAFLLGFILSLNILIQSRSQDITKKQKGLNLLLFCGTIFAWGNFSFEVYKFYLSKTTEKISCSGVPAENVFFTPCFIGACIFLTALIVSLYIKKCDKSQSGAF